MTEFPTIAHFSQSNPSGPTQGDVAALLRRVAESITELGEVDVQDVVFHAELDDEGEAWPSMTVYFYAPEKPSRQRPSCGARKPTVRRARLWRAAMPIQETIPVTVGPVLCRVDRRNDMVSCMTTSTITEQVEPQSRRRRPATGAVVVVVLLGLLVTGWWWGRGPQSWWTARSFVEALKRGDCSAAAKYYAGDTASSGCSPSAYWLPDDLNGYSLHWDRIGRGPLDDQAAVAVTVPQDRTAYSLHMVRRGAGWVIEEIDASA